MKVLWLMPALQAIFLCFFSIVAVSHWLYSWGLLLPCLVTGQQARLPVAFVVDSFARLAASQADAAVKHAGSQADFVVRLAVSRCGLVLRRAATDLIVKTLHQAVWQCCVIHWTRPFISA